MKGFGSGFNNFFVGLFSGLLLPIIIIMVLMLVTVDKLTSFAQDEAIAPLYTRGAQTLDKFDALIETLDDKVSDADLEDIKMLAPLKDANLFPELKKISTAVDKIRNASDSEKQDTLISLKGQLKASLQQKFPEEKAQQLAENLMGIADVLASQKDELTEKVQDKVDDLQLESVQVEN